MQLTLLSFPEILVSKVTERLPCQENFLTVYSNEKDIESSSNVSTWKAYHLSTHTLADVILLSTQMRILFCPNFELVILNWGIAN